MDGGDTFCFRLNMFERSVKASWQELQIEKEFCDLTLACEDKTIKTHKLVVSACSPVLRNILMINQAPHSVIYLRKVKFRNLHNLINFMYQGEVNIAEEDLASFLEVADDLNVRGLSKGNMDSLDSNEEDIPKFTPKSTDESLKQRAVENNEDNFDDKYFVSPFFKFAEDCENIINNDINEVSNSTDIQVEANKKVSSKNDNQNTIAQDCDNIINNDMNEVPNSTDTQVEANKKVSSENDNQNTISMLVDSRQRLVQNIISTLEHNTNKLVKDIELKSCDQCEYQTKKTSHLKQHRRRIHEGVHYSCNQCKYKTKTTSYLKQHIKSSHEGEHYQCNQCEYSVIGQLKLKRHIKLIHEGKCFPCKQCDYEATHQAHLKIHITSIHEGKRYPCDQCDYKATQKSHLYKHKKVFCKINKNEF